MSVNRQSERGQVVWSKGMFLTPQHFQTQARFQHETQHFRFMSSCYANWGVTELAFDRAALANGQLLLLRCSGVLGDGLTFQIPDVNAGPPTRALDAECCANGSFEDLYLGIPDGLTSGAHVTQPGESSDGYVDGGASRFLAVKINVVDETNPKETKPVQVRRFNFRLLLGRENRDGWTAMRIGRIVKDFSGQFVFDSEFIPACLDIGASEILTSILRNRCEILRTKRSSLSSDLRQKERGVAEFGASDVPKYWLRHTVSSYLPVLEHVLKTRRGHPEPLFVAMLGLAGALSTFATDDSLDLPQYDHDNLGVCIKELDKKIDSLLDTVIPSKCVKIPLEKDIATGIYAGTITSEKYLKDCDFYLAVSSSMGIERIIARVPRIVKVASPEQIQGRIALSTPGVALHHTPLPPPAIPARGDHQYFLLERQGDFWPTIVRSRHINIHVPDEIVAAKLELLVVMR